MEWKNEQDFKQIKRMLTEKPCLGNYAKDKEHCLVTMDASKTGLGVTLAKTRQRRHKTDCIW